MRANTHKRECSETVLFPKCGVELRFVLYAKRLLHLQNALSSGISIGQQVLSQTLPNDLNHALAWPIRYKGKPIAKSSFNQQFRVAAFLKLSMKHRDVEWSHLV